MKVYFNVSGVDRFVKNVSRCMYANYRFDNKTGLYYDGPVFEYPHHKGTKELCGLTGKTPEILFNEAFPGFKYYPSEEAAVAEIGWDNMLDYYFRSEGYYPKDFLKRYAKASSVYEEVKKILVGDLSEIDPTKAAVSLRIAAAFFKDVFLGYTYQPLSVILASGKDGDGYYFITIYQEVIHFLKD